MVDWTKEFEGLAFKGRLRLVVIEKPVILESSNTLSVEVRGKPGGVIAIQIIGIDDDPPTITATAEPLPNAAEWNNTDVTVSFDCSDSTSGVATCPQPVTVATEGANQEITGTDFLAAQPEATSGRPRQSGAVRRCSCSLAGSSGSPGR